MNEKTRLIRVGHSPDPDDAFMFYAFAEGKIPTGRYRFEHELADIETLNQRARRGELELTAISVHAYAYVHQHYVLCPCGASVGDGYGPIVVARQPVRADQLIARPIAVPGHWTTAVLALSLCLGGGMDYVIVPFDRILEAVAQGQYEGRPVDAGLVIHEGQLTYGDHQLVLILDLGRWWLEQTGLPLPLGVNALRRDLGRQTGREVTALLRDSIRYGLDHRSEALQYARQFGRGLDLPRADRFVQMYVNDWTLDLGPRGRRAIEELLARAHTCGLIPHPVQPEFVD